MKTYVIIPDIHVPFHDISYVSTITKVIRYVKPHGIVQLGDFIDAPQISRFADSKKTSLSRLISDLMEYKEILYEWCGLLPKGGVFHQIFGNHEERLAKFVLNNATPIEEFVQTIPEILGVRSVKGPKVIVHPYGVWDSCKIAGVVFTHGFYYNMHTAMNNLNKYHCSIVQGHTHRVQYVSNGRYFSATLGHGSDESKTAHSPTPTGWQQAFGIFTEGRGLEIYLVTDGATLCRGKEF